MLNHRRFGIILIVLCIVTLATITSFANSLWSDTTYLPLVILQRPPPTPSATGLLLITELLYNPSSDPAPEPAGEWIEIYNPGPGPVLLSAYKLGDEPSPGGYAPVPSRYDPGTRRSGYRGKSGSGLPEYV